MSDRTRGDGQALPAENATADLQDDKKACRCGTRFKHTPRSEKMQRDVKNRLNRAAGQINAVKAMVVENRYCGDVLTQLAAAQSALSAVSRIILEEHLRTCVVERVQQGDTEVISELMDLIKKFS